MTNEQIVAEIQNGYSVTDNVQLLYEKNLPLIKKFIKPYCAYESMEDLLQEGYLGLWEAVKRYESSGNIKFMTYSYYWIVQAVRKYIEKCGSTVRIPNHARQKMTRLRRTMSQLRQEQGAEPTAAEIADLMGISVEEVQEIKGYMQGVASLDTPLSGYEDLTLSDTLQADLNIENDTVDKIYNEYSESELWRIVEHYTAERENAIIKEIFVNKKTMAQIARENGLTFGRIRQIKESGLRKLRIGKAKRELLEKFNIVEAGIYRGGLNNYREHDFVSIVEHTAIKRIEAEERYKRHIAEIEEMHRNRLVRNSEKVDLPSNEEESKK